MDKIRGSLIPKLVQCTHTHSRKISNDGYNYITRPKNRNKSPVSRFKTENTNTTFSTQNQVPKKPFSRGGPYRVGMAKHCQIVKRYEVPISTCYYPLYPGMDKVPLSTYVTNWRWYAPVKEDPETKPLDSRIRGVGMDGYLQAMNQSGIEEIQKVLREKPMAADNPGGTWRKDTYKD